MVLGMSWFESLPKLPPDPIFGILSKFKEDERAHKVNLSVGAYRDERGKPYVLEVVREAERLLLQQGLNKEYLPLGGDSEFLELGMDLLFGSAKEERMAAIQTVGGTGALRLAADFFAVRASRRVVYSDPAWENYRNIFTKAGYQVETYPYYRDHQLRFNDLCGVLTTLPPETLVVLQGCCHNPTGCDLSMEQWRELSDLIKHQQLIPFFDMAYQGLGVGIEKDAASVRHFVSEGHEMCVAYSFSKNMGLYGERVGFLSVVAQNREGASRALDHIKWIARGIYSTPSLQGGRIAKTILGNAKLRQQWEKELEQIRIRIAAMRKALYVGLKSSGCPYDLHFLEQQQGMFSYSGLTREQVLQLRERDALYMPDSGRINVAGLNTKNLPGIIQAMGTLWQS